MIYYRLILDIESNNRYVKYLPKALSYSRYSKIKTCLIPFSRSMNSDKVLVFKNFKRAKDNIIKNGCV